MSVDVFKNGDMCFDTIVLKIKMKDFVIAGMICFIDIAKAKVVNADCLAINTGTLLKDFEVTRSYKILQNLIYEIKLKQESYDTEYTNMLIESLKINLNKKNLIPEIIQFAKKDEIEKIVGILKIIFENDTMHQFELTVGIEWINLEMDKKGSADAKYKYLIDKAFEIIPLSSPVKGTPVSELKKPDVIFIKFEEDALKNPQIERLLDKDKDGNLIKRKKAIITEVIPREEKGVQLLMVLVEISDGIFGKCVVPQTLKIKKFSLSDESKTSPAKKIKSTKSSKLTSIIISVIVIILLIVIIYFVLFDPK